MPGERDDRRARLEAIVYGRPGIVDDRTFAGASVELEALDARARAASVESERVATAVRAADEARIAPAPLDQPPARPVPIRRWPVVVAGAAAIGVLAVIGGMISRPDTDSLAIFERPQSEADLGTQLLLDSPATVQVDTLRYVGLADGFDVYVYRPPRDGENPSATAEQACMAVIAEGLVRVGGCEDATEFADGMTLRVGTSVYGDGTISAYEDLTWSIQSGITLSPADSTFGLNPLRP